MLVSIIIGLIILAVFLYAFNNYVTLEPGLKNLISFIAVMLFLLFLLHVLGVV